MAEDPEGPDENAATEPSDAAANAPAPPPNPRGLTEAAVTAIPELALHQAAVEKVFVCHATYVGGGEVAVIHTEPATAVTELALTRGWKQADIDAACDEVMEGLADAWTALAKAFNEASTEAGDEATDALDFDLVRRRLADERAEQDALRKRARELLERVKTVSGQLGIPNPDAGPVEPVEAADEESGALGMLTAGLRRIASPFVIFEDEPGAPVAASGAAAPGWRSPPILAEGDADVQTLEQVVARRAASAADVQVIWAGLAGLGLDRAEVTALLARVATKARAQLAQSQAVMSQVTTSAKGFGERIEAIERLTGVTRAVHAFFHPPAGRT